MRCRGKGGGNEAGEAEKPHHGVSFPCAKEEVSPGKSFHAPEKEDEDDEDLCDFLWPGRGKGVGKDLHRGSSLQREKRLEKPSNGAAQRREVGGYDGGGGVKVGQTKLEGDKKCQKRQKKRDGPVVKLRALYVALRAGAIFFLQRIIPYFWRRGIEGELPRRESRKQAMTDKEASAAISVRKMFWPREARRMDAFRASSISPGLKPPSGPM